MRPVKLLVPTLPRAHEVLPFLARIDEAAQYTNFGPLCREFEAGLAALSQADHAVSVASGTLGLEVALAALPLAPGARVLVPSLTFPATATAVVRAGLVPVFADVDARSLVLTPAIARRAAQEAAIAAIVPVALHGQLQDCGAWDAFTRETGLPVLVDAAGAIGRQRVGRTTAIVVSLHATKPFAAGEGGFIAAHDADFADRCRSLTNFGFEGGCVRRIGTNAKMSEYHAAIGLAALAQWPRTLERWTRLYAAYAARLDGRAPVLRIATAPDAPSNLSVLLPGGRVDHVAARLSDERIETRRWYWPPLHRHPAFAACERCADLTRTEEVCDRLIGLPFHLGLDEADVARVCDAVARIVGETS